MDMAILKGLRQTEESLGLPLIAPDVADDPEFELSDEDVRHGIIRRVGELALNDDVGIESILSKEERSHLHYLYNLENHLSTTSNGNTQILLREHQHNVLEDIYNFLASPPTTDSGCVQRRGYIELPTGSGKTAIFSTLVNVLNRPLPGTELKPKALVLVPKLDLVGQTVGVDGQRGFAQFAQDTEVSEYHGKKKDLSGEAVVMSYQSLLGAVERGDISGDDFDLIICDEAHRALGKKTRAAIEQIANGNLMLGLTASPEFKNRHVRDLFPEQIHSMELRETIEMNLLSPVRCFAVASDAEIETLKSGEFSEKELAQLIENEWRNKKAVEFAKVFVADGKSGIVSCLPGEGTKHASDIAESIGQEFIEDKITGEFRRIRAVAVSGTSENRQAIYEAFERGEIDVLTYVDVLTEGWDSTRAKFLINLRPTTSPVNAIQRLGRVLRKSDDPKDIATVVEFIDKTDKQLFTFFHVFGEETIEQGNVVGGKKNTHGESEGPEGGDEELIDLELPEDVLERLAQIDHINLRELVVLAEEVLEAPEGAVRLKELAKQLSVRISTLARVAEELEIDLKRYKFDENIATGITEDQLKAILKDPRLSVKSSPDDVTSINELISLLGVNNKRITELLDEIGVAPSMYKFGPNKGRGITEAQKDRLLEHPFFKVAEAPEGAMSINQTTRNLHVDKATLLRILEELDIAPISYNFNGRHVAGITSEQKELLLTHPHFLAEPAPEGVISVAAFIKQTGCRIVDKLIEESGLELKTYKFGPRNAQGLDEGQQATLKEIIATVPQKAPEGVMSVQKFAKSNGSTFKTVDAIIKEIGLDLDVFRIGTRNTHGLTPSQQEILIAELQRRFYR